MGLRGSQIQVSAICRRRLRQTLEEIHLPGEVKYTPDDPRLKGFLAGVGLVVRLPAGLSASRRLLLLRGPSAVSGFVVTLWIRVTIYCFPIRPYSHVFNERAKTLTPFFANSYAASCIVLVLRVIVSAPLFHLPPARVRPLETFTKHRFAAAYFSLSVMADATAAHTGGEPQGPLGRWIFFAPDTHSADYLHHHFSAIVRHSGFTTGTPTARRIPAAKICPPNR